MPPVRETAGIVWGEEDLAHLWRCDSPENALKQVYPGRVYSVVCSIEGPEHPLGMVDDFTTITVNRGDSIDTMLYSRLQWFADTSALTETQFLPIFDADTRQLIEFEVHYHADCIRSRPEAVP